MMRNHDDRLCETTQAVLGRVLDGRLTDDRLTTDRLTADRLTDDRLTADRLANDRSMDDRPTTDRPRRAVPHREHPDRRLPQRPSFEPARLLTPSCWGTADFMALGVGVLLIVGMFVAVAQGITWVVLPGATAVIFAMISTQQRWDRARRGQWLRYQRDRRGTEAGGQLSQGRVKTGGIVHLPGQKDSSRRVG